MWFYKNKEFTQDDIGDAFGFIYIITNSITNRKYIGKKFFSKAGRKQTKGKIKKVRVKSDWESYYGSNKELQEEVKTLGAENFHREIIHLCYSKSECSYRETEEIFKRGALLTDSYYNSWVTCRIHKAHVINKIEEQHGP
jgi:hypothetical protein